MSKKMLKRSLALGTLMAFVITGNVSAENWSTKDIENNGEFEGTMYVASNNNAEGIVESGEYTGQTLIFAGKCADSNNTGTNGKVTIGQGVTIKSSKMGIVTGCINGTEYTNAVNVAVSGNEVIVNGGSLEVAYIYGGYNYSEGTNNTTNNVVQINGGAIKASSSITGLTGTGVIGGYKYKNGEVKENSVIITGGEITGDVYGGYHNNEGSAIKNSVVISGGKVTGDVYGGYARGKRGKGVSDENVVTITGGEVIGNVYGGRVELKTTSVKDNVVNVSGTAIVKEANLIGGDGISNVTGNTLNIGWDGLKNIVSAWEGTIGSAQKFSTINMFEGSKVTFGNPLNDAKVAVNVKGATWNVDKTNTVGSASFDKNSVLVLKGNGNQFTEAGEYALNGKGILSVEQGAKLTVEGIKETTYNVATGFETISENKWQVTDLNTLMEGKWLEDANKNLQLQVTAKKAEDLAEDMGVSVNIANTMTDIITAANENKNIEPGTPQAGVVEFANALADAAPEVAGQAVEAVVKMAEEVGQSAIAASIVKNVTDITNDRLSFNCGHSAPQKGGHGVGLLEEGSGADVWVEYVHGKDDVENMKSTAGATSYEGQYNGFVMGVDFKKVNKFQSGIAFNYGEGDTNSVGSLTRTHSDYDFWGVGYYGNIHNDDSNVIFDINYAKTDSDVTQKNLTGDIEASPEATTWTAGVKVEKLYQNENVRIVPYTGLRYMSIDADDYSTKCGTYNYKMERKDIWLLPVGVSIKQEVANDNGWTVSPRVDLSYIWAFGDTDSNMGFGHALDNKITNIGYDVMDDGSFLGLVGIEAHKGQWGYGVAYSYQKGDHSESKKWYVDVNYSF